MSMIGKSLMKRNYLKKEESFSNLNIEETTDSDYMDGKRLCEDFKIKNFGEYQDLYLRSDTLLLAEFFENFRKMCLKIYRVDPVKFILAPR